MHTTIAELNTYNSFIFDCDGVLLDSNRIKTAAFFKSALPYGHLYADQLCNFHIKNGGVSRYSKATYFFENILQRSACSFNDELEQFLISFSAHCRTSLACCEMTKALPLFKDLMPSINMFVVSGSDQVELREVLSSRGISTYFNDDIYGSPSSKYQILSDLICSGKLIYPCLFFGDSQLDYDVASAFHIDFAFISEWSDIKRDDLVVSANSRLKFFQFVQLDSIFSSLIG